MSEKICRTVNLRTKSVRKLVGIRVSNGFSTLCKVGKPHTHFTHPTLNGKKKDEG